MANDIMGNMHKCHKRTVTPVFGWIKLRDTGGGYGGTDTGGDTLNAQEVLSHSCSPLPWAENSLFPNQL